MDTEGEEVDHVTVIVPLVIVVLLIILVRRHLCQPNYHHIPTVGPSRFPFYYIGAFRFFFNSPRLLQDGFKRHSSSIFKVADFARWNVVVTGAQLIEELRTMQWDQLVSTDPHDCAVLSVNHGVSSVLCTRLTRNLPVVVAEMRDETVKALSDVVLKASSDEGAVWTEVIVVDALVEVVSRVFNRVVVGPQLCRSPELASLGKGHIQYRCRRANVLAIFPTPVCRVLLRLFGGVSRCRRLRRALRAKFNQRREKPQEETYDLLSSLAAKPNTDFYEIENALLTLNIQAVPSCALNLTNALYYLAACSASTVQTMRKEIEEAIRPDGWTMSALDRMVKVDSFLKETLRLSGLDALTMRRIAVVPYTFSDGTCMPRGTHVGVACTQTHLDATKYDAPTTFDAFRFAGGTGPRYRLTTAAPEFLAWGLGRGACPGRFLAGAVMKLVLAHVVLKYDVRFPEEDKLVPGMKWVGARGIPDLERKVLLGKQSR